MLIKVKRANCADELITLGAMPDACPHCHYAGKQIVANADVVWLRRLQEHDLWLMMKCPRNECGKPYFAVFAEPPFSMRMPGDDTYKLNYVTPASAQKHQRHSDIQKISPDFYEILDQSAGAERYRLPLIAGAGYRKALEYLVKDYVLAPYRKQLREAKEGADTNAIEATVAEMKTILNRNLGGKNGVIALIPDAKLQAVAERAVWLGNDEIHYTRKWDDKDIGDLKTIIGMVINLIASNADFARLMAEMPGPRS